MTPLKRLAHYDIEAVMAERADSVLYKAYDTVKRRHVTLKTVHPDKLTSVDGERLKDRLRREARLAGSLDHRNIVAVYEFSEDADPPYMAMEHLEGQRLQQLLPGKPDSARRRRRQ